MLTVACPFFKFERSGKLYCEGGSIRFRSRKHRAEYIGSYCACVKEHKACSLAKELYRQYDYEEEKRIDESRKGQV